MSSASLSSSPPPHPHPPVQWLVRLDDRTWVLSYPASSSTTSFTIPTGRHDDYLEEVRREWWSLWMQQELSQRTGLPSFCLHIDPGQYPYARAQYRHSFLLGGKGGFGTLLKGQSRQAGAQVTTNFGACRDLQGRRLRHVNEQIDRDLWQTWQRKRQQGLATEAQVVEALIQASSQTSGLVGWHLPLPAWADVSVRREQRQVQKQYRSWLRTQQRQDQEKARQREIQEQQVQRYVQSTQRANQTVQRSLQQALQQGLQVAAAAAAQARRTSLQPPPTVSSESSNTEGRADEPQKEPEAPSALLTLSGDVILAQVPQQHHPQQQQQQQQQQQLRWQIQSQSNFATVGIVLQEPDSWPSSAASSSSLYYEIQLVTGGLVQVGWATPAFRPQSDSGDGVGDDPHSWGYDGSRSLLLHPSPAETSPLASAPSIGEHQQEAKATSEGLADAGVASAAGVAEETSVTTTADSSQRYGPSRPWKALDVVGCRYDWQTGQIFFSINDQDLGCAFVVPPISEESLWSAQEKMADKEGGSRDDPDQTTPAAVSSTHVAKSASRPLLFPAMSCNPGEIVELRLHAEEQQYRPPGSLAVGEILAGPERIIDDDDDDPVEEKDEKANGSFKSGPGETNKGNDHEDPLDDHKRPAQASPPVITRGELAAASTETEMNPSAATGPTPTVEHVKKSPADGKAQPASSLREVEAGENGHDEEAVVAQKLDLSLYQSAQELEPLGMDFLKRALAARGMKCGGTLSERAARLFALKGRTEIPEQLLARPSSSSKRTSSQRKRVKLVHT